jgi:D-sedoheptulose 7-phosphate isomerase
MEPSGARLDVRGEIEKTAQMLRALSADSRLVAEIERAAETIIAALNSGHKVLFAGNGGSAADAQHLAAELVGRLALERKGLPALALTADTSVLTALGNDYGFDRVFARQVEALGAAGDVLVAISTSGRSKNVVAALGVARARPQDDRARGRSGRRDGGIMRHVPQNSVARNAENPGRPYRRRPHHLRPRRRGDRTYGVRRSDSPAA